jgi:FkbM family methyltransferase
MRGTIRTLARAGLERAGERLPERVRLGLAKRSAALRHVVSRSGEFVYHEYLGRLSIRIDPRNSIEMDVFRGRYELDVQRVIRDYVSRGDFCIDVGANVGAISLSLCDRVGPTGHVYCFEPGPPFLERLRANFALNPTLLERASLHAVGLSDREMELLWSQDPDHPWNGGFIPHETKVKLPVVTLDSFVSENAVPRVDFIKIDVEGMELDVLAGAAKTLAQFHPKILVETLMDFEPAEGRKIRKELEALLRDHGYELYEVTPEGRQGPVAYPNLPANTLALHRGERVG